MLKIIIPNYNKESYLKELFDSLYPQLTENCRIYFIDDCSTDKSVSILENHPIKKFTTLIQNEGRQWCSISRNKGLEYVTSEDWFCFIDSDDYVKSNYIETLENYIQDGKSDIYVYKEQIIDEITKEEFPLDDQMAIYTRLYKGFLAELVKMRENKELKEAHAGEDTFYNIDSSLKAFRISYCDDIIYVYRRSVKNGESEISGMSWETKKNYWKENK